MDNMEEFYGLFSASTRAYAITGGNIETFCRLDNERHIHNPSSSLGLFDKLPLEILHLVFAQLDIQTLTDSRRVNKQTRMIIDSISEYKKTILKAPNVIRTSLGIECARWISCEGLYRTLCTTACSSCGALGGYIHLLTCRRICYLCFTTKREFLPLLRADVIRKFGLKLKHISKLPSLRTLPGKYTLFRLYNYRRIVLIDHGSALKAGIAVHGSLSAMEQYASERLHARLEKYTARRISYDNRLEDAPRPRRPKSGDSVDKGEFDPRRFMGVVCAPYLDACTGSPAGDTLVSPA